MEKKYLGYCRVSTDEQVKDGFGIEAQRTAVQDYARLYQLKLDKIIVDEGKSGKNLDREGIQEIIQHIRSGEYEGVIAYKLDRISRNLKDILILHDDVFKPNSASIISVNEQFDTSTPMGKLVFQMIGGFAEFEREMIQDRMESGKKEKAKRGGFAGGRIPYGYDSINKELVINEKEAAIVRKIFEYRKEGKTLQYIADELNNNDVPTKLGGKWSRVHIKSILDRENFYKGFYRYSNIVTKGKHQPIILGN
ncbi:recombinase family protein [Aneurinibacillus thermoaerophilus]|uniref:recombinase family protein n=1 Tax=Aneurinibacillus thermoaerophilus TaxID=143495 RepID=UPI002E1E2365|nr:recombinase family protein [Aneurinibacillus thermoaerophilus]